MPVKMTSRICYGTAKVYRIVRMSHFVSLNQATARICTWNEDNLGAKIT